RPRPTRSTRWAVTPGTPGRMSVVPSLPSRSRLTMPLSAWPDAVSSAAAAGESLRPSYTPTTMQPVRSFAGLPLLTLNSTSASLLGDAAREDAENFTVERIAQYLVFDA